MAAESLEAAVLTEEASLCLRVNGDLLRNISFAITLPNEDPLTWIVPVPGDTMPVAIGESPATLRLEGRAGSRALSGEVSIARCGTGFVWRSRIWPDDHRAWEIAEIAEFSAEIPSDASARWKVFHADNIRGISAGRTLLEGSYWVDVADLKNPLKSGRWQSFPGAWMQNAATGKGFVLGELSQKIWKHTVELATDSDGLRIKGRFRAPGIASRAFAAGEAYESEPLYFEFVDASTPEHAFAGYVQALQSGLRPCMASSLLRRRAFWDSWNDRQPHFWDVSEALIQRTARVLQERFPSVASMEVDDGYAHAGFYDVQADRWGKLEHGIDPEAQIASVRRVRRLGAAFLHEPDRAITRDRFPRGLRAARNEIFAAGFLPAIWLGLNVVFDASLVRDHPEWFIPCQSSPGADPELDVVFGPAAHQGFRVLDPSLPEVRGYLTKIADVLFEEWGFGAFKLDFWSYAFENDGFRLQRPERSAFEWRAWLFEHFRSRLAEHSYFTIGCDISTGNPFVCPWVDNIRYGIDIGNGRWENIKYTALTGTFLLHVQAYRFFILNCDSVGLLPRLADSERQVFWAWAVVTRALCEVAGDLAMQPREALRSLQRLLLAPKNGEPAFVSGNRHLDRNEPAEIVWTKGDNFSAVEGSLCLPDVVLGVFNWSDEPAEIAVDAAIFGGLEGSEILDADLLSPGDVQRRESRWIVRLPARSVRLSHLSLVRGLSPRVLDSAWSIQAISHRDECLHLKLHGDDPQGVVIFWPHATPPELVSSVPVAIARISSKIYRIAVSGSDLTLCDWDLRLSLEPS